MCMQDIDIAKSQYVKSAWYDAGDGTINVDRLPASMYRRRIIFHFVDGDLLQLPIMKVYRKQDITPDEPIAVFMGSPPYIMDVNVYGSLMFEDLAYSVSEAGLSRNFRTLDIWLNEPVVLGSVPVKSEVYK